MEVRIERADLRSEDARVLIEALNAELTERYPEPGANHFRLDADEVTDGRGAFLVATSDGVVAGCGAIRRLNATEAEIKRMYVVPAMRGQGVGGSIVAALEDVAVGLGVTRLVLETGERQPEAIALYSRVGFAIVPAFGEYVGSAFSVCMAKELAIKP